MRAAFYKDGSLIKMDRNHRSSTTGEMTVRVSVSDEGWYKCKFADGTESEERELRVKANRPKAELRADDRDIPVGGSVTLTCSVKPSSSGWKYFWYRGENTSEPLTSQLSAGPIRVSEGGVYWCRGGRGDPVYYTEYSDPITVYKKVPNKAVVTLQPNWSEIYRGERITLRCEIKDGGDTEWEYEWKKNSSGKPLNQNELHISFAYVSHSGVYRCKCRKKREKSSTDWSDPFILTVSDTNRPKAELRADDRDIPVGGSVTLTCSVKPSSSGWKYFWYRGEKTSEPLSSQLSAGPIRVSEGGVYWCRGGRGDPVYYTEYSDPVTIKKDVPNKAVVTLQPNWSEIYRGERITLRCEIKDGGDTEWEYEWRTSSSEKPSNQNELSIRSVSASHSGVYRYQSSLRAPTQIVWTTRLIITPLSSMVMFVSMKQSEDVKKLNMIHALSDQSSLRAPTQIMWTLRMIITPLSSMVMFVSMKQSEMVKKLNMIVSTVSVLDMKMGHTLLAVLGLFCRRKATLTADRTIIPLGGNVTLTCSVKDPAGFRYEWFRQTSDYPRNTSLQTENVEESYRVISQGGKYTCRGLRSEPHVITPDSNEVIIYETVSNRATLTLQPNWPQIFRGETITLRCDIQRGGVNQWMYEWTKDNLNTPPTHNEHRIIRATEADSGEYRCKGRRDSYSSTRWSDVITLTVSSNRPKAELRPDDRDIPVGGSVTLTCSVKPSSSGWKYFWYRGEKTSEPLSSQLSAGPIRVSEGGVYWCRGGRGDPVYYTEYSDPVTIYKKVPNKAVVTLQPNWSEIFRGERITLRCEIKDGGDTVWEYEWRTTSSEKPSNQNELSIRSVSASHSGVYRCKGRKKREKSSTDWSDPFKLTVSDTNRPKAELRADDRDIPVGGSVTLTCSVKPSSSGWKYFWYRGEKTSEPLTSQLSAGPIRVSEGGVYWCRGGRGDPVYYTEYSDPVTVSSNVPNKAVVTLQPNWSEIFRGERITLRCEIKDGGDTEWEYEWRTSSSEKPSNQNELSIRSVSASHSGVYRCKGRKKREKSPTDWSDPFILTVSDKAQSVLTVSPSWLSAGASVTLNCRVKDQSAGWRFYWYKTVPDPSHNFYSYELLPGSSSGTEQDSYIVDGQTHTAGYVCRAGRGDPVFYTDYSQPQFVWSADFHPAASLTVSPDRVQHFIQDSVTLKCDGNSTSWRVMKFNEYGSMSQCSYWGTVTGSTCNTHTSQHINGVYWCESETGQFSNAVNITGQYSEIILVNSVHPVAEGHSVTLGCKLKTETVLSNVDFYKDGQLIQNGTRRELTIPAVSTSDEGFYKCKGKDSPHGLQSWTSPESWMSVKSVTRPESSSFPVLWIAGLVGGVLLILLLLLLLLVCLYHRYTKSKESSFIRSQSTNQGSATDHTINQDESLFKEMPSSLYGDAGLYESIKGLEEAEHEESSDATYSSIELRTIGKTNGPEKGTVYLNMKMESAGDDSVMYAQVHCHNKAKKDDRKSSPASADETVYSEVKPGAPLGQ
ncbi:basement membrane-specific heparan sulfate proteoglycan core protein-like [Acanthopagrus schlegelii]